MTKFLIYFILLLQANLFSQITDSSSAVPSGVLPDLSFPKDTVIVDTAIVPGIDTIAADTVLILAPDTTTVSDTTAILDSARTSAIVDTLYPVKQGLLYSGSTFIGEEKLRDIYSGYEGNYLIESENVFIRDRAFTGYPDKEYYYGSGSINFMEDGLGMNAFNGFAATNNIFLESVDSIEFVPAVRGFLYGQSFKRGSINFITKDFLSQAPFTRIKYYEGPDGEGMINGLFNSVFLNRLNVYADVTNRSFDERYFNTDFTNWQAKIKAKYFLSNRINILGSYNFNRYLTGLNGGVDVDSITTSVEETFYDPVLAPVIFRTRQLEEKQHLFRLRALAHAFKNSYSDFNLYYGFSLSRVFANEDAHASDLSLKNKTFGTLLNQKFIAGIFDIDMRGVFEHSDVLVNYYSSDLPSTQKNTFYSLSAAGSVTLADSLIIPSIFYRIGRTEIPAAGTLNGYGADISIIPLKNLKIYTGYSVQDILNNGESGVIFEAGLAFKTNNFSLRGNYYTRDNFPEFNDELSYEIRPVPLRLVTENHSAVSGHAEVRVWNILLFSSANYPLGDNFAGLPELTSRSGLFFEGYLFNKNLNLRSGFLFFYWGKQNLLFNNMMYAGPLEEFSPYYVPESYRIDFSMAAEIQRSAILYFTWENITDNRYYITPFFPMQLSGIKFGVSWELFN